MRWVAKFARKRATSQAPDPFDVGGIPTKRSIGWLNNELVEARLRARLTQQEVGRRMGTTKSAISRLERGLVHRPTLTTIENYALVVGCRIEIHLLRWP